MEILQLGKELLDGIVVDRIQPPAQDTVEHKQAPSGHQDRQKDGFLEA
jgi:hypothetical protein